MVKKIHTVNSVITTTFSVNFLAVFLAPDNKTSESSDAKAVQLKITGTAPDAIA